MINLSMTQPRQMMKGVNRFTYKKDTSKSSQADEKVEHDESRLSSLPL
jgi:hypothetical protein